MQIRLPVRLVLGVALLGETPVIANAQVQHASSPVVELLTKARNALNDLAYAKADTLARQALSLGSLLTLEQQLAAIQVRAVAAYPEETAARKTDSAVAIIRQMLSLGGKTIPRELSSPDLDSLITLVARASEPAKVVFGSKTPGAIVYVNDSPQGTISGLRTVVLPPAVDVRVSIRAERCTPWDTTMVVRAADSVRVGIRTLKCQP